MNRTSPPSHRGSAVASGAGVAVTGLATALLLVMLMVILGVVAVHGLPSLSWRFVASMPRQGFFEPASAAVLPMIIGTTVRVLLMTLFVMPVGVTTAVYLSEYARAGSPYTRAVRAAVANLAGVPSIVFGLFGLGFFINFLGRRLDVWAGNSGPVWGQPSLLWASVTLAVMTLPVVIVSAEESLRGVPGGLREASLALGATKLETITGIVIPHALPGILTGGILAISRAAGEVAPILFTGAAYYVSRLPGNLTDQFMDLGYHSYVLATQSPNVEQTEPMLFATVLVLLALSFSLNALAILVRMRMRRKLRASG